MQLEEFLRTACALPGLSGNELAVAEHVAAAFRPYADEVKIDRLNNVIAHVKGEGPKVVFCAHIDEIGLMVVKIEEESPCGTAFCMSMASSRVEYFIT